jgi:hypothetical protein
MEEFISNEVSQYCHIRSYTALTSRGRLRDGEPEAGVE